MASQEEILQEVMNRLQAEQERVMKQYNELVKDVPHYVNQLDDVMQLARDNPDLPETTAAQIFDSLQFQARIQALQEEYASLREQEQTLNTLLGKDP